jgi:two-component system cell cycle response regulator
MAARILTIDDNRANLELMVYLLEAHGYEIAAASDGLLALERASRATFDLVLCDILMPGIDGFEFLRRFRADSQNAGSKVIAVTALAMVGDKERILGAGFDGYIAKPIEPEHFIEQVAEFLKPGPPHAGQQPPEVPFPRPETAPDGPLILVVDDVPVNIEVMRGSLEPFGFRIVSAHNAVEALERCTEVLPDLILCDLHMPHGDGFSFITRVKERADLAKIPFLFISSTTWHSGDKERGLELGALKFLHRPIDPKQLLVEVKNAMARR